VEQVRNDIFRGRRKSGDRLPPEHVLAEQFNVSRTGVREALRVLEAQGLVRIRHGYAGGVFVADGGLSSVLGALETSLQLGQLEVNELYEARVLFEPTIARLVVERANDATIKLLEDNVRRGKAALAAGADVFVINLRYHAILAEAAGNRVLSLVMQAFLELLERLGHDYPTNRKISDHAVDDHAHLLEAIRTRDAARAERLMVRHLRDLEGRFARIEERIRRSRPTTEKPIPTWGGIRLEPSAAQNAAQKNQS